MKDKFIKFAELHNLFNKNSKILLGVSGGMDSMLMLDLFIKNNIKIAVAHCNFKLRENESDNDEEFIEKYSKENKLTFFSISFNTIEYAKQNKISIEMAARRLRYSWFDKLLQKHKFDSVAIAHHKDDIVETFNINIIRGTGIKGLTGIKEKTGNIIRPLLFATKKQVIDYSKSNNLQYRNDSSNNEDIYTRNKLRLNIIPEIEKINPAYKKNVVENIKRLREIEIIYNKQIEITKQECIHYKDNNTYINLRKLRKLYPIKTYLYEFLVNYSFSNKILDDIIGSFDKSGKLFYSHSHRISISREFLIISDLKSTEKQNYSINKDVDTIDINNYSITIRKYINNNKIVISKSENIAQIDFDLLKFPLEIRSWEKGDYFYPLGMNKKKKLSDFFIDKKFSLEDKENTLLLCSNKNIVWLVGQRIDNRYKITNKTKKIIEFKFHATLLPNKH